MLRISLNTHILSAIVGVAFGAVAWSGRIPAGKQGVYLCELVGNLFIDMLKMVLAPLVFTSIAVGIANLRQHSQMHKVWKATLGFFALTMAIAVALGLGSANLFHPGKGLNLDLFQNAQQHFADKQMSFAEFIAAFLHGLFLNPFAALVQGSVLPIVVFALILGVALVVGGDRYRNILLLMQEGLELMLLMVGWIMRLAPYGVMALLAKLLATQNMALLSSLAQFVGMVLGVTLLHGFVVLPLLLFMFARVTPLRFFRGAAKRW